MKAFHNKWFVFFSMMFLFKPGILSGMSSLGAIDSLFDIMRILLCLICSLLLIKSAIPLNKASIVLGLIACNEVWKILSSLMNGTSYTDWGSTLNVFGISIFTYLALRQSAEAFFKGGSLLLGSYVVINALTVFLFPNGLYASSMYTMNFFLSYRTAWFVFYLEAAFLCLLNNELYPSKEAKNWLVFVLVCEYLSMIKVWTATGLLCITLGLLLVYLWKKKRIPSFSVKAIILGEIVLCAIIVLFHMQDKFSFLIVGILVLVLLSRGISEIEVVHSDREIREYLLTELEKYGIKKYSFKKSYAELSKIEEEILQNNKDRLEWIEIVEYGTKYTVRVEERRLNSKSNDFQYQNIISRKNAVITRIEAFEGEKLKFVNDYVKKGDIVISGEIMKPDNTSSLVMAQGNVYGEVWYEVSIFYPYVYQESRLTGKSCNRYAVYFFGKRYGIFDFKKFRTFQSKKNTLFSFNFLDIQLVREKEYETVVRDEIYTADMLESKARDYVKKKLLRDNPYIRKILEMKVLKSSEDSKGKSFQIFTKVEEEIGEVQEISNPLEEKSVN